MNNNILEPKLDPSKLDKMIANAVEFEQEKPVLRKAANNNWSWLKFPAISAATACAVVIALLVALPQTGVIDNKPEIALETEIDLMIADMYLDDLDDGISYLDMSCVSEAQDFLDC